MKLYDSFNETREKHYWLAQLITYINNNSTKQYLIDNYQKTNLALNNTEISKQELLFDLRKEFIDNFRVA